MNYFFFFAAPFLAVVFFAAVAFFVVFFFAGISSLLGNSEYCDASDPRDLKDRSSSIRRNGHAKIFRATAAIGARTHMQNRKLEQ